MGVKPPEGGGQSDRNIHLFCLFFVVGSYGCSAQSDCDCYERFRRLHNYYYSVEDYSSATTVMERIVTYQDVAKSYDHLALSDLYKNAGKYEKALLQLNLAIEKGETVPDVLSDKVFSSYFKNNLNEASDWIAEFEQSRIKYLMNLDIEYLQYLNDIRGGDQTFRKMHRLGKITKTDSLFYQFDQFNYNRIKEAIAQYGMPSLKVHGFNGFKEYIYLVLLHASMYGEEQFEEILSIAEEANQECMISRHDIATLIDCRDIWYHKKPQTIGVWNAYRSEEFKSIKDVVSVDSVRFEYNLLRLEEVAKKEKRKLPAGYVKLDYPPGYFCGYLFVE